jgi:hypothetical protein
MSELIKIRFAVLDLLKANRQTDRQTDMAKPLGAFLQL